jgi:hypothetical protein
MVVWLGLLFGGNFDDFDMFWGKNSYKKCKEDG